RTIYERPANMFVASFIGSPAMNFIEGRLMNGGSGWQFVADGVSLGVGVDFAGLTERNVILGVRPEELKVVEGHELGAIEGIIDVVEPTGPDTMLTTTIGRQTIVARVAPRFAGKRGEQVTFAVDQASINLFDPK